MDLNLNGRLNVAQLSAFVFQPETFKKVTVDESLLKKIQFSRRTLQTLIEDRVPIYGVTTGFGDRHQQCIDPDQALELQKNLIQYLSCGQGEDIPVEAARAMSLIRLHSLSRGYSAVSPELLEQMRTLLEHNICPAVPSEGSLGASGDLVPLAYLARTVQGQGEVYFKNEKRAAAEVFAELGLKPYELKAKEGLAIVNGTSTMSGMILYNLKRISFLVDLASLCTAWQCLALNGRLEAFSVFINEIAKTNPGQKEAASQIRQLLAAEDYKVARGQSISIEDRKTTTSMQDPYSLRCAPQVLGPIRENLATAWQTLQHEVDSITDNPLIDDEGRLEMGGNFYGGYLCQSMDFLKINLAHLVDLADRQVTMLVTENSNRGLPANLINKPGLPERDLHLHHGLKGVHQSISAITSEVMQKATPSGIFSRSSESHNQDKVSLGMSAAMTCHEMVSKVFRIYTMQLVCLAQALDLRGIKLKGPRSVQIYDAIRSSVPFVERDRSLGAEIAKLNESLVDMAHRS